MVEQVVFVCRDASLEERMREGLAGLALPIVSASELAALDGRVDDGPFVLLVEEAALGAWPRRTLNRLREVHPRVRLVVLTRAVESRMRDQPEEPSLWILGDDWQGHELLTTVRVALDHVARDDPESGEPERVVVIEDETADAMLLRHNLRRCGFEDAQVELFDRLDRAIEAIREDAPDYILTDLNLPDCEGLRTVQNLQSCAAQTPIIVLSGQSDEATAIEALKLGAQDYLVKNKTEVEQLNRALRYARERKRAEVRLAQLAHHDALTGLNNRATFHRRLQRAIELCARHGDRLAVLFLDLDRFKQINDRMGHEVGDRVLFEVAQRFRRAVREEDVLCRWGGDEFVILLRNLVDADQARRVAERVRRRVERPLKIAGFFIEPECSLGLAVFPDHGGTGDELIQAADAAMYEAKRQGGGGIVARCPEIERRSRSLGRALDERRFVIHYQPQVDPTTGAVVGMEALLRWKPDEDGRVIPPDEFIPELERSGRIQAVGRWVIEQACRRAVAWREGPFPGLRVSVNLSPKEIESRTLPTAIERILAETGLPPDALELEITESALIHDIDLAADALNRLRETGIRLAVDDFGKGQTSLAYLDRFPIDTLKIDRSFVQSGAEGSTAIIVKAIIGLGRSLGMRVVAEGVETQGQLARLRTLGCDVVQGYLLGRPEPAERWDAAPPEVTPETAVAPGSSTDAPGLRARRS